MEIIYIYIYDGNIIGNNWSVAIGTNQNLVFGAAKTTMAETALFYKALVQLEIMGLAYIFG